MYERSIISKSGQSTKGVLALVLVFLGALIVLLGSFGSTHLPATSQALIALCGIALFLAGGLYGSFAIRCPKCRARWVWLAVSRASVSSWGAQLLSQEACPVCGWTTSGRCR